MRQKRSPLLLIGESNKNKMVAKNKGISLLEILVVITVFSILAILATMAILLTLRGTRKSEALVRVRSNVDYSLAIIERNIRNAESFINCGSETNAISYLNENGISSSFTCGADYIASGSARLTSEEVEVVSCSFICDDSTSPPSVEISIGARDASATGIEGVQMTTSTKIFLRTYQ
jgi:Tfp pilus assembly protein PilW